MLLQKIPVKFLDTVELLPIIISQLLCADLNSFNNCLNI